jgi:hypothetical protein
MRCLSDALHAIEMVNSDEGRESVSRGDADSYGGPTAISETSWEGARRAYQYALGVAAREQRSAA